MGAWPVRTLSLLLMLALTPGPALAAMCGALCPSTRAVLVFDEPPVHHHHDASGDRASSDNPADDQHPPAHAIARDVTAAAPHAPLTLHAPGPSCCAAHGTAQVSTAVSRASTPSAPESAVLAVLAVPTASAGAVVTRRAHAGLPGTLSLRPPLVLRI